VRERWRICCGFGYFFILTSGDLDTFGETPLKRGLLSGECIVKVRCRVADNSETNFGLAIALIRMGEIGLCSIMVLLR
jgi:hypothetical protein